MAKFMIVVCAVLGVATASPGVVAPFGGVPFAYASHLPYSAALAYSPSLAYTSPVAYGLASGGSSRIDIQNNYNVAPQYAVPLGAAPFAYTAAAPLAARIAASYAVSAPLATAPLGYNAPVSFSAPLFQVRNNLNAVPLAAAPLAGVPLAAGRLTAAPVAAAPLAAPLAAPPLPAAPLAAAPLSAGPIPAAPLSAAPLSAAPLSAAPVPVAPVAAPTPFAAKIATPVPAGFAPSPFVPAPLRYSAPLLSNYNAPLFGSPLSYAFPGQFNALPFASPLTAAPVSPINFAPAPAPTLPAGAPQTTQLTAVSEANPEDDSEVINARLQSKSPADANGRVIATPAPVDGQQAASRDASIASQSPVAPVRKN